MELLKTFLHLQGQKITKSARDPFEVNNRSVIAFREMGRGQAAMERFTMLINMPPPTGKSSSYKRMSSVADAFIEESQEVMKAAADIIMMVYAPNPKPLVETTVTIDGTWHRRGHSSLHGVVTAIDASTVKVLDTEVSCKVCKECKTWAKNAKRGQRRIPAP